jgi:hypothetical protein
MARALRAFRKIQISNVEGTPGTAEAATEVFLGMLTQMVHDQLLHTPDHDRGVLAQLYEAPFRVSDDPGEIEIEVELYDRLMVFICANAVRGNVTPTQPDNINEPLHYLWVFEPNMTSPNTPDETNGIDTFTTEWGDNVGAWEMEHTYTISFEITGEPNEPVMISWTISGWQITATTFTGALTAPAVAYFPSNLATFFIDTSYAGIGGTQLTGFLRAWTYTFETQFVKLRAADGTFYASGLLENKKSPVLEMTFYRDSTNYEAELTKFLAVPQTTTYIRIALLSHTEMDIAQDNPPYIYIDGAYLYTEFPELEDEDGTVVSTVTATGRYDATAAKMMTISVGTTMAAFA